MQMGEKRMQKIAGYARKAITEYRMIAPGPAAVPEKYFAVEGT